MTTPNDARVSAPTAGDPAVQELQAILVKYGFMTEQQMNTGPGVLGPKTRAAVDRVLQGKVQVVPSSKPGNRLVSDKSAQTQGITYYIVQAGDSPEAIAKRVGVSVSQLESHPENAYMKERLRKGGYSLYPGDRLAIPGTALKLKEPKHDASMLDMLLEYLQDLTNSHPAAQTQQQTVIKKKSSLKTTTTTNTANKKQDPALLLPMQGYTRKHPRIQSSVILTKPIETAFLSLVDYLPSATVMTSGYRSDADQERVINDYYKKAGGSPLITDVEKRRQWLVNEKGLKIARVGNSPHRTGLAFDLSGGNLDEIKAAVDKCAKEHSQKFPLLSTLVERSKLQQCLHVNLNPAQAKVS